MGDLFGDWGQIKRHILECSGDHDQWGNARLPIWASIVDSRKPCVKLALQILQVGHFNNSRQGIEPIRYQETVPSPLALIDSDSPFLSPCEYALDDKRFANPIRNC